MAANDHFPRGRLPPSQSPLYWVMNKDRYLRQLLIRDIEENTNRELLIYFSNCDTDSFINSQDDTYLSELLRASGKNKPIDLMLETNGGMTDATEKVCAQLRQATQDLRVIVPRRAKSNGTVIALCGSQILMGMESELGPIDPSIANIPVEFILNAPQGSFSPIDYQMADTARKQTRKLASSLLSTGMKQGIELDALEELINKLATRDHYHSHGSVIDVREAKALGLNVMELSSDDALWQMIWLLRSMCHYDCARNNYAKLFESRSVSLPVSVTAAPNN